MTILLALLVPASTLAQTVVEPDDRTALGLTVYDGFAQVRDVRDVSLPAGRRPVVWNGIPDRIDPGTVVFLVGGRPLDPGSLVVEATPVDGAALLRDHVGREVTLVAPDGRRLEAVLVSPTEPIYRIDDRLVLDWQGHVEVPVDPGAPSGTPRILATLGGPADEVTASYLVDGLRWSADYVGVLRDGEPMSLHGTATIVNGSATGWPDVTLHLVAGDVPRGPGGRGGPVRRDVARMAVSEAAGPERESLGDVHLYAIAGTVSIPASATARVPLFDPARVAVEREYVLDGAPWVYQSRQPDLPPLERPRVRLRFDNDGIAGEDEPLPAGTVHLYRRDRAGTLRFVGDAGLPDTPAGERVVLEAGTAFDVVAERTQTSFSRIDERTHETAWRIEIRNRGDESRTIRVVESFPGEWSVLEESRAHERIDARTAVWEVPVGAGGSATLTYRVRVTF